MAEELTLVDIIEREMRADDESPERKSEKLVSRYEEASETERAAMDDLLMTLCGWTLQTLREKTARANLGLEDYFDPEDDDDA